MMTAGTAKIDITPDRNVWMDGMIREHRSEGVHDELFARALVLANDEDLVEACVIVSVNVCSIDEKDIGVVRDAVFRKTGISQDRILIASSHTHSGPATVGFLGPAEPEYVKELCDKLIKVIEQALDNMQPVAVGCGSGREDTISHYRRLLADDGRVIMNWEPFPAEHIVRPLGEIDPEVGVLKFVEVENPDRTVCILFNHSGHPNILSGDNYLISADYPGFAEKLLEERFHCPAMFVNGAQGTMDIDGLKDRDWKGVVRAGTALAGAVAATIAGINCSADASVGVSSVRYTVPKRKITDEELAWAEDILKETEGEIQAMADGVGDDYKAKLYKEIHESGHTVVDVEHICVTAAGAALITFPGELFTEIGMKIKAGSPFEHTYVLGLVNGKIGYIPTRGAVSEGGYAVDTRRVDAGAEDIIVEQSLKLLNEARK